MVSLASNPATPRPFQVMSESAQPFIPQKARSASFDVAYFFPVPAELGLAKMARPFTTTRSLESLQPRKEPRHGHGRRIGAGSQEVDRDTRAQGQRQASGDPRGRRVPVACRENVLLAGGWGCALRGSTPGSDQPLPGAATLAETRYQLDVAADAAGPRGRDGLFVCIIDATLVSQAGKKTENTYSTGNRQRRPRKGRRYGKNKHARKNCHSFTMGLLITPSGIRIPFCKPYHTREYCKKHGLVHRTTAEAAADLIRELPLPEGARSDRAGRYGLRRRSGPRCLRKTAATPGYFRATPSVSWLARKGSGRRCVRS